jgi:feruloyl esterase
MRMVRALAAFGAALLAPAVARAADCQALAHAAFADAHDVVAERVEAGGFAGRVPFAAPAMFPSGDARLAANPAFCRIRASLRPSADSDIRVEVWLPAQGWNGKFLAVGSFGWGGAIMVGGLLDGLAHGYAVANTDTGHQGMGADFALGHPEKLIDYAWRADHEMVRYAKTLIRQRYGRGPAKSYWIGCSLGGLEGLIEASRFPADFDGIVAGAPPNPITAFNGAQVWASWLVSKDPAREIPEAKFATIHAAVIAQCGGTVGKAQNLVEQPDRCTFDPVRLQCQGADRPDCLTPQQVFLMRRIYQGPRNSGTGQVIFPGPARGSELTLAMFARPQPMGVAFDMFRDVAFANPAFTLADMDFGKTYDAAAAKIGPLMHVGSDLAAYFRHGGKLLFYIGWNDFHNPTELIAYYQRLARDAGPLAGPGTRLFTLPGMNHCMGGEGCDTFNRLAAIDQWASTGRAPVEMTSYKYDDQGRELRSRPICAWPAVARYKGAGRFDDAASFACVPPR